MAINIKKYLLKDRKQNYTSTYFSLSLRSQYKNEFTYDVWNSFWDARGFLLNYRIKEHIMGYNEET